MSVASAWGYAELDEDVYYLIDSGPGRATIQPGDRPVTLNQHLAAQFTLLQGDTIVDIEGWLGYLSFLGSLPVRVSVYGDAGDVPDSTTVYWAQDFSVPSAGPVFPYPADWFGVYGITLPLDPGTYWVSFGLITDGFGSGGMPPTPFQEFDNYALGNPTGGWSGDDTLNIGVRIGVPEPGMSALLSAGLLGLVFLHGRRQAGADGRLDH
jgi:hypothetical protein